MVIVEGFPGCGKSTTAQWLARRFRTRGDRAEWFYEDQRPHPLARPTAGTYWSWREYFAERLRRWSLLANQAASSRTVTILDSAWLQVPLFVMLRQDVDRRVIRAFIRKTVDAMRSAGPTLVYLSQPDPVGGMRRLFEERGMAWALLHAGRSDAPGTSEPGASGDRRAPAVLARAQRAGRGDRPRAGHARAHPRPP